MLSMLSTISTTTIKHVVMLSSPTLFVLFYQILTLLQVSTAIVVLVYINKQIILLALETGRLLD